MTEPTVGSRRSSSLGSGTRPRLLDLFCCQGGATKGYQDAGFQVVGVDLSPQPRYIGDAFVQTDAVDLLRRLVAGGGLLNVVDTAEFLRLDDFDAIHASPPCQAFTKAQQLQGNEHPELIEPIRDLCLDAGLPYVIENVEGAPLHDPVRLCGTMFGLPLYRHRLFECSFTVTEPLHGQHYLKQVKMGRRPGADEILQPVGHFSGVAEARVGMEMPWANQDGLREAIPPAYTAYIGGYLMSAVSGTATEAAA